MGIEGQRKLEKFAILTRKPRSHARILIYRTWPISDKLTEKNAPQVVIFLSFHFFIGNNFVCVFLTAKAVHP